VKIYRNKATLAAAVAGINTIALATIQYMTIDDELQKLLTVVTPILIAGLVYVIDWLLASLNLESAAKMRAIEQIDKKVGYLKAELKEAENLGINKSVIEKELQNAIVAKGEVYTAREVDQISTSRSKN
jgi:hypothetical protein